MVLDMLIFPLMTASKALSGKRILVVDDDLSTLESLKQLLKADQHTVATASSSDEAEELFRKQIFDLVISDYLMPATSGNELAAKLWRQTPSQRFLLMTGYFETIVNAGVPPEAILPKPFGLCELREAIAKALA